VNVSVQTAENAEVKNDEAVGFEKKSWWIKAVR
jgi:hypothetical protein